MFLIAKIKKENKTVKRILLSITNGKKDGVCLILLTLRNLLGHPVKHELPVVTSRIL